MPSTERVVKELAWEGLAHRISAFDKQGTIPPSQTSPLPESLPKPSELAAKQPSGWSSCDDYHKEQLAQVADESINDDGFTDD